jgi:deoxyribodipyrimidine photolyase-related protein
MSLTLRLILGDQLSLSISSLRDADPERDVIMLAEVREEATYVKHHKKKIIFLFSAMRHFAEGLRQQGFQVAYTTLDDPHNTHSLFGEVERRIRDFRPQHVVVTEAGEYRLAQAMQGWEKALGLPVEIREDNRFLCSHQTFCDWAQGRRELVMEYFYREMRKSTGLLMEKGKPAGGNWNFDKQNRQSPKKGMRFKGPLKWVPDAITRKVIALVKREFADHFGDAEPFWFAVTREQAEASLAHFIEHSLPFFGDYQDAMLRGEPFLYHSILSPYINAGLLDPREVCEAAEHAYHAGDAPLNAVEGFIRQIIGWREFIRGIYWLHMPDYAGKNALDATRAMPDFYWTAHTQMRCMAETVRMTREEAYSHHIQRLMVTGNFALLAGLDVQAVHQWYLEVYADAYEWVELPNTLGMALHGDGGIVGTKPYIASGAYIQRMSNYCQSCPYNPKEKLGEEACPFATLYWDFLLRHRKRFASNRRMALAYKNVDRLTAVEQESIRAQAAHLLENLDTV